MKAKPPSLKLWRAKPEGVHIIFFSYLLSPEAVVGE